MSSQSDQETEILSLIRRSIRKYGDIVGAKVTRIRTYAKFLDKNNYHDVQLLSYAVKFASNFYGPFRDAVGSKNLLPLEQLDRYLYH